MKRRCTLTLELIETQENDQIKVDISKPDKDDKKSGYLQDLIGVASLVVSSFLSAEDELEIEDLQNFIHKLMAKQKLKQQEAQNEQ